jgi:AcrR family transcriptional regulator
MNDSIKEKISCAAIKLFLDKGYAQVTIQNICEDCGITKPTFYKYAGSKENLILDLYDITIKGLLIDNYLFLSTATHYEQLLLVFRTLISVTAKYGPDLFSQMFISNLTSDHHSLDMRENLTKLCVVLIEKSKQAGEIRAAGSATAIYRGIAHMFTGYECLWCIKKGAYEWESEFFESLEELLGVREDLRTTDVGERKPEI